MTKALTALFGVSLKSANAIFFWANVALIVGAVLVLLGTMAAFWAGGVRDKYADERIAKNERDTAVAQNEAAQAKQKTESERLARIELEKMVGWRAISLERRHEMASRLQKYAGTRIQIWMTAGDPEAFALASQIKAVAIEAGWEVVAYQPILSMLTPRIGIDIGVPSDSQIRAAGAALGSEFQQLGFDCSEADQNNPNLQQPNLSIVVGLKPLPGMK